MLEKIQEQLAISYSESVEIFIKDTLAELRKYQDPEDEIVQPDF